MTVRLAGNDLMIRKYMSVVNVVLNRLRYKFGRMPTRMNITATWRMTVTEDGVSSVRTIYILFQSRIHPKMQLWWQSRDSMTMQRIMGLKECDYLQDDNSQAFVNTANEWWDNRDYDEKRNIYKEYNNE